MLRCSDADGTSQDRPRPRQRPLRVVGAPDVIDLTERSDVLRNAPAGIDRSERQAIGRVLRGIGHLLDAAALTVPLLGYAALPGRELRWSVAMVFVAVGTVLLWPTHRRGRQLVGPGEGLVSVATRIGLAPVATAVIVSIFGSRSFTNPADLIDLTAVLQIVVFTLPPVLLGRMVTFLLSSAARRRGYDLEDTIIVGTGSVGLEVAAILTENPRFGLVPCGYVDSFDEEHDLPLIGSPEDLPAILHLTGVRHVVLAFGAATEAELVRIVRRCHDDRLRFYAVPRLFELGVSHDDVGYEVDGLPLVTLRGPGVSARTRTAKRAFDVVASGLLLVLAAPVMLACAVAVKATSLGPVFFRQVRIGIGGRPFEILKFRTMRCADEAPVTWTADEDRVTRVGRLLRPTHLDELPQLMNVLRGEMSLIGPRPERPHFVERFGAEIDDYHDRHRVPVGITGWAQVNGFWGDTSIETRVRLDNRYIENWSLRRDLVIALRTIPTMLGHRR